MLSRSTYRLPHRVLALRHPPAPQRLVIHHQFFLHERFGHQRRAEVGVAFLPIPAITVKRSLSFSLIVSVSMWWRGCYRNPAEMGTFLSSYDADNLDGVPTESERGVDSRQFESYAPATNFISLTPVMLNRIFVGLALVASLFVAVFGIVSVKPRIEQIVEQRKTEKEAKEQALTKLASTEKTLKATDDKLKKTESDLKTTTEQKTAALAEAKRQQDRGDKLATDLKTTAEDLAVVRAEIFIWKQLGLTPEQVRATVKQLKDTVEERDVFVAENKTLQRNVLKLQNRIDDLIGTNTFVALPDSARGKVVVVDPKFEFCVLDFGDNKGALERGELLVNRNGQLIAKLRIHSVKNDRCIANIVSGWRLGEVLEGDAVFPAGN